MFKIKNIDLDEIVEEKEVIVEFPYENITRVYKMKVFCDCSRVYNYRRDNKIVVKYTPKKLAPHLSIVSIVKMVIIYYNSDRAPGEELEDTLTFTAKVVRAKVKEEKHET